MKLSNQGRDVEQLLADVPAGVLKDMTTALWIEARRHPDTAHCECPAMEALAVLYQHGYKVVKTDGSATQQ